MAKPEDVGRNPAKGPDHDKQRGQGKGQDKVYEVTNPATGEVRTVTQREWREQKLGRAGFVKPPDLDETEGPEEPEEPSSPV